MASGALAHEDGLNVPEIGNAWGIIRGPDLALSRSVLNDCRAEAGAEKRHRAGDRERRDFSLLWDE
jgi:hypothetical protein